MLQHQLFLGKRALQLALGQERKHIRRHPDHRALRQFARQPFDRAAAQAQFFQYDATAGQLLFGLFPIAAVGPQSRFISANHQGAGRAGKAGKPAAGLPVFRQVFGKVGVGAGNNPAGQTALLHGFAQGG